MIFDVLIFALGFLTAALLSLAALPPVWRRALRLTEERLARLVPLSAEEIAAERDHLRAGHAVALRRVEQRLERVDGECAALRAAAGRRETEVLRIEADRAAWRDKAGVLERDGEALRHEMRGLWAEIGAEAMALHGLSTLAEARLRDIAVLQAERDGLRGEVDRLAGEVDRCRGAVAGLETRLVGADARNGDLGRELARAMRELAQRRDAEAVRAEPPEVEAPRRDPGAPSDDGITAAAPGDGGEARRASAGELEALRTELAFMVEQAASAERRATDAAKALEALREERAADGRRPAGEAELRAALAALAEDVLRTANAAAG